VSAVFPSLDGMVGVLAGRSPLVAALGTGQLRTEGPDGRESSFFVSGGFTHIRENRVTVLADQCIPAEDLDPEKAWTELQDAASLPNRTDEERKTRDEALEVARAKFSTAQKHRRRSMRELSTSENV